MQLFWAIEYQANPNLGGTVGSISSSIDEGVVGPFTLSNSSVFQLLNSLIVKSSKGGAWIVKDTVAEHGAPPSDSPFWKVVSYDR